MDKLVINVACDAYTKAANAWRWRPGLENWYRTRHEECMEVALKAVNSSKPSGDDQ